MPGRNDPCPCGSGKKYKKCCLESAQLKSKSNSTVKNIASEKKQQAISSWKWPVFEEDHLDRDSNHVVDLIHSGHLDEAEKAAHELLKNYPEVNDGFDRLAMVYEARGDRTRAIEMYQKALESMIDKDGYNKEMCDFYRNKIAELKK